MLMAIVLSTCALVEIYRSGPNALRYATDRQRNVWIIICEFFFINI